MLNLFEDLLREKTQGTPSDILFAQWNYDKKIVGSVLQSVSNLFPHYSLHDESHSITILNNIIRVLGQDNLTKLSAIDLWLLLEAAYWHDTGMVVAGSEIQETFKSEAFLLFFEELRSNKSSSLYEHADKFEIEDEKILFKDKVIDLEAIDSLKFILAEYFRRIHADRSSQLVTAPMTALHIPSPRTIIPDRIFKLLGRICSSHTKDFDSVMQLPFKEVGIDVEDAHPRFVSCMLRIGDLLDLDNNRFSEVMLATIAKVPTETWLHKAKHLSIELFRVDRQTIKITASCDDYDVANLAQHWFNYLNSEISNQMIRWNEIVPELNLGYLPTIGRLKVELKNYQYIDARKKPKFTVDTDKALSLLQGAGIYNSPHQSIREILQNGLDSTLVRIWLEHQDLNFSEPNSADFKKIADKYALTVRIDKTSVNENSIIWKVEIEDHGIGISKSDLTYLTNTGSSSRNQQRRSIIKKMPPWLRPSGIFGIGFQSIFMLSDQVIVETKSFFDQRLLSVELNAPNSKRAGDVLLQEKATTHAQKPGARMIFLITTDRIPEKYSVQSGSLAYRIARDFDPFYQESMDIEVGQTQDEVLAFADKSCLPVKLFVDGKEKETRKSTETPFQYFDPETSLEISIHPVGPKSRPRTSVYYKGQAVEARIDFAFFATEINIHGSKASEVLTLNRNKIQPEYRPKLYEQARSSVIEIHKHAF